MKELREIEVRDIGFERGLVVEDGQAFGSDLAGNAREGRLGGASHEVVHTTAMRGDDERWLPLFRRKSHCVNAVADFRRQISEWDDLLCPERSRAGHSFNQMLLVVPVWCACKRWSVAEAFDWKKVWLGVVHPF